MTSITLGGREIALARPDDLATRVGSLAGVTPAELAGMLSAPTVLAVAVLALSIVPDMPDRADLGTLIAESDMVAIAEVLRPLLTEATAALPPTQQQEAPNAAE